MTRRLFVVVLSVTCFAVAACESSSGGGFWPHGQPGGNADSGMAGDATNLPGDASRTNIPGTDLPAGFDRGTGTLPTDTGGAIGQDIQLVVPDSGTPLPTDTGGSTANASCMDIVMCIQSTCLSDPTTMMPCMAQCKMKGGPEAQQAADALINCLMQAGQGACAETCSDPSSSECTGCIAEACGSQTAACQAAGGGGTTTQPDDAVKAACKEIAVCAIKCQGDQTCGNGCVSSNPTGANAFIAMNNCIVQACQGMTGDAQQKCALQAQAPGGACATQTDACVTGTGTCAGIQTCLQSCATNPDRIGCQVNCQFTGTLEAQKQFNDFQLCAVESITGTCAQSCPAGMSDTSQACAQCYNQACQSQIQACMTGTSSGGGTGGSGGSGGGSNPFDPFGHPLPYHHFQFGL